MYIRQSIENNLSRIAASLALALFVSLAAPVTAQAMAVQAWTAAPSSVTADAVPAAPSNIGLSKIDPGGLPQSSADTGTIQNVIRVFFGIIGAFALFSITASGLKYITSAGDPGKTSEAKKGIIFALAGLMIAVSAEAIVAFVIHRGAP